MEQFIEQAPTYDQCIQKIRSKYGEWAKINVMYQKTIRQKGFLGFGHRELVELTGTVSQGHSRYTLGLPTGPQKPFDLEEEKKKILLAAGKPDPNLKILLTELKSEVKIIKEKIEARPAAADAGETHPTLGRLEEILALNDFSPSYSAKIMDRARNEFSLVDLVDYDRVQDWVVEWIGESIQLYTAPPLKTRPRVMVLVGPTGVGKTTTIAKLAAVFGVGAAGRPPLSVRMITIDNYRIAAKQQIETYGGIMGIPVSCVENYEDLRKTLALYAEDVDLILIDTIGKSPRDFEKLGEMKHLLAVCGSQAEVHLTLAATTKSSDIRDILKHFEPFDYRSVIITKLDETIRLGNVISVLADQGKTISYVTDGQRVPMDIRKAGVIRFLINLEGFKINRERIEKRFPNEESDIMQWRQ
jgi:flagellar biosynthesis protein FlhF